MQIFFKPNILHGYAKLEGERVVLIAPISQKNNAKFLTQLEQLGQKLINKLSKKQKNQIFDTDSVLLFGEKVPYSQLPTFTTSKERSIFFKAQLFEYSNPFLQQTAQQLGFSDIPLNIRLAKSKRGSCTADNRIMLNQNLVHFPTQLIKYVIIHEICHLKEKNHSSEFWALVEQLCPNYKALRKTLKKQILIIDKSHTIMG